MKKLISFFIFLFFTGIYTSVLLAQQASNTTLLNKYMFVSSYDVKQSVCERIPVPVGFKRTIVSKGSFSDWLRYLPLKPGKPEVHLYNGKLKGNQDVHFAVVNIDVGNTDIQQCADAVIRLRAEYLYSIKDYDRLHFDFTSGHSVGFKKWAQGYRTVIKGNNVTWTKSAAPNEGYPVFRGYCNIIFNYAGTSSLSKELKPVKDINDMKIGDVFIVGGFPGHAVLVVDMCENVKTGEKLFMIQQSYMPAQEIHILKNYNSNNLSPWYSLNFGSELETPEWTFRKDQLMRFE
jgi:hypothetical protein